MQKFAHPFILFITLLVVAAACSGNDAQNRFESQAYAEPSNITETQFDGSTIRIDSDDWRISPLYVGLIEVEPIFPNPIQYGTNANLEVVINGATINSSLELGYLTETNNWFPLQIQEVNSDFELVTFLVDTRQFGSNADQARGIHRMLLFDGSRRLISYGDILIE
jgi:hypothetical protein